MLRYFSKETRIITQVLDCDRIPPTGIWYDLYQPTDEEIKAVEELLKVPLPRAEEMQEIESSSRLYQENDVYYMTLSMVASADTKQPVFAPVTFVLTNEKLITIRDIEPKPFQNFIIKAQKNFKSELCAELLLITLLEMIVDRAADIVEKVGEEIESVSQEIFKVKNHTVQQRELKEILTHIGMQGDLTSKMRISLENMHRLLKFVLVEGEIVSRAKERTERLTILQRDVVSITDHISFLFNKINFLLDATLGLISIEQNGIVKIFSVAAVIFLPPTLIASIYGMNFHFIPELALPFGYPLAIILMIVSAIFPYYYFKRKGWL